MIDKLYGLKCDGCGALAPLVADSVDEARLDAADEGWRVGVSVPSTIKRHRRMDYCPECQGKAQGAFPAPMDRP